MKNTYKYFVPDQGADADSAFEIQSGWGPEYGWCLAEEIAKDYHSEHDGWESEWPVVFTILQEDGTLIGTYSVDRDYSPVFSAYKVQE